MDLVNVIPLGGINHRIDIGNLVRSLNRVQEQYRFQLLPSITNLPKPSHKATPGSVPQYDSTELSSHILSQTSELGDQIRVAIIDHEVFDEYYSVVDETNNIIVVSTRSGDLREILGNARKTIHDYMTLEIGAQLLALAYRRTIGEGFPPLECAPPWHEARQECIFDFYGLSAENTSKLMHPELCGYCANLFKTGGVSDATIQATLAIVAEAARLKLRTLATLTFSKDPVLVLFGGASVGSVLGMATEAGPVMIFAAPVLVLGFVARIFFVTRRRNQD